MEKKHILLITYCFSPEQTPRAFKLEMIVNFLTNKGYKVDIFITKYNFMTRPILKNVRYYEVRQTLIDNYFNKKLSKSDSYNINNNYNNCYLLRIRSIFKKFCSFCYYKIAWPDSSVIRYFFAKKELKKIINNNQYDCLLSSALPFTSHLLGYYAKKQLKIKWIAEYGDPFSFNSQPQKNIFRFLNKYIEKKLIGKMDYIVVPFEGSKEGFLANFPFLKKDKIKIIPQAIPSLHPDPGKIKWDNFVKSKINIVYAGIFYIPFRSPKILLESLVNLRKGNMLTYYKIRIHIFGNIGSKEVREMFSNEYKQLIDENIIILYGETQREVCAFAYRKSDYLLNIANNSKYQLPSKLIEYLSFKKPIISLENAKNKTPDWPFLIKENYKVDNLVNLFREISNESVKYSFNNYDNIIKKYDIKNIGQQYIKTIL